MKPLQLDDDRGAEGLHVGQLKERDTGTPCGESLRGMDASKLPVWRRGVWWPGLSSTRHWRKPKISLPTLRWTWKLIYDLINVPSSKRGLLNPGVTIIWDNGSIYRQGSFDVFWPNQDQSGGKMSKVTLGFYI